MDGVVSSMEKRFISNSQIYTDLSWLSLQNFQHINSKLSNKAFVNLALKLKKIDQDIKPENLKSELLSFAVNWKYLKKSESESYQTTMQPNSDKDNNDD